VLPTFSRMGFTGGLLPGLWHLPDYI